MHMFWRKWGGKEGPGLCFGCVCLVFWLVVLLKLPRGAQTCRIMLIFEFGMLLDRQGRAVSRVDA